MFTDKVKIQVAAGRGGHGIVAWTRRKYLPKGGPCGGDGGNGGSVYLRSSKNIYSLDHLKNTRILKGENGENGINNFKHGKQGKDLIIQIPCGTFIIDANTKQLLHDVINENEQIELCKGGRGGLGNNHFKTPTNRTPLKCTQGKAGTTLTIELELKLIADVGFVGLPNAGKSTLLNALTATNVKIGNYPFTTCRPNLSYIQFEDYSRIYLADIPGIIKDANQGRGLGLEFLRHIERSKVLVYIIDIGAQDGRSPIDDFALLQNEIRLYNPLLLDKPFLIALNKTDLPDAKKYIEEFISKYHFPKDTLFQISAINKTGLENLIMQMKNRNLKASIVCQKI